MMICIDPHHHPPPAAAFPLKKKNATLDLLALSLSLLLDFEEVLARALQAAARQRQT